MNGDILPTHKCFDDALDLLSLLVVQDQRRAYTEQFKLVHGICAPPNVTGRYAHAWVEQDGEYVIFSGILDEQLSYFQAKREDFYRDFGVVDFTRYTIREASFENFRHNHFGPWEEKYRVLCGDEKRVFGKSQVAYQLEGEVVARNL